MQRSGKAWIRLGVGRLALAGLGKEWHGGARSGTVGMGAGRSGRAR